VANVVFTVQLDLMTRQNVFLQSVSTSRLVYHTAAQKQMSLASLETQYPGLVKVGSEGAFVMARIAQDLARHEKPPIMVVGGDGLGAELAYNLAVHFVTRFHRDDLVTRILESFDLYVGYSGFEDGLQNTTGTCGQAELEASWLEELRMHEEKFGCLLRIGLHGGSTAILTSSGPQASSLVRIGEVFGSGAAVSRCTGSPSPPANTLNGLQTSLMVGLSCCQKPDNLGELWDHTRKSLLESMGYIQGVHLHLFDETGAEADASFTINISSSDNRAFNFVVNRGEVWRLLEAGNYQLEISGRGYGLKKENVTVNPGEISHVRVRMEPEGGIPGFAILAFLSSAIGVALLCCTMLKQQRQGGGGSHNRYAFKPLNKKKRKPGVFFSDDSEEEEIELDAALDKIGIKGDYDADGYSSSSEIEDVLLQHNP